MIAQIRPCVLEAIERLRSKNPAILDNNTILKRHARYLLEGRGWHKPYGVLNGITISDMALILNGHFEVEDPVEKELQDNLILTRAQGILRRQTAKGIEKYGTAVQASDLSLEEWIDHASEEAADLLVYLQAIKEKLHPDREHVKIDMDGWDKRE